MLNHGADAMQALLSKPQDLLDFALRSKLAGSHGLGIVALVKNELLPWVSKITDKMQRSFLITKLSDLSGISKVDIESELRESMRQGGTVTPTVKIASATVQKPRPPSRTLDTLEFDFFGQLYFSKPGEFATVNMDEQTDAKKLPSLLDVEKFLQSELSLDDLWMEFATEILQALKAAQTPHEQTMNFWVSANDAQVTTLIDKLVAKSSAFTNIHHGEKVYRLMREQLLRNLRGSVSKLKAKLPTATRSSP